MNKFLEMKERGEKILFSELLEDIPPDYVLIDLFPNTRNPAKMLVSHAGLEVLDLRLKGLTQAEIVERLGLTPGQVAYRSKEVKNALHMNVPPYIRVDIPALARLLNVPHELTGYTLLSELLRDMPSDEELMRLFIERGSIRGGKRELAPTNRDLQLLQMRAQRQDYASIGEAMGMDTKEVQHQISLVLHRIMRDLQIKLDVPTLYSPRRSLSHPEPAKDPEFEEKKRLSILTARQREVWLLYKQEKKKSKIAEDLGISCGAVSGHIYSAERRLREYDHYYAVEERNEEPVALPLTRGEVKIIIEALSLYKKELEHITVRRAGSDWVGKLPFETKIVADLYDKAQTAIYRGSIIRIAPNVNEE